MDEEPITTYEPFSHLTSAMIHTIGASVDCRPSTPPETRNAVSTNPRHTLAEPEGQRDCSMVGWNTLLKFIECQTPDGCKFHDASDELNLSFAAAQGDLDAPSRSCNDPSHQSESILEGDDLVDMDSRLKIARAVALLLRVSDEARKSQVPGTLHHGIRTRSASAGCSSALQQFQTLQSKELRASHEEVNTLPSWQYQTHKPTSARASVDRSGEASDNENPAACLFIVDPGPNVLDLRFPLKLACEQSWIPSSVISHQQPPYRAAQE